MTGPAIRSRGVSACSPWVSVPVDVPDLHVQLTKATLVALVQGETTWADAVGAGTVTVTPDASVLLELMACFDGW